MERKAISYQPIGTIHSPHQQVSGMPIQPSAAKGVQGCVVVTPQYQEGLQDLDGFSHLILLYHFHRVEEVRLKVTPFLDQQQRGVFSTRAPTRPNPIGISIVRLLRLEGNQLEVADIDVLDGTPLLDIKPYVPYFDRPENVQAGWIEASKDDVQNKQSDDRFSSPS